MRFDTRAIHVGQEADEKTGAVITPIYQTSTYMQDGIDKIYGTKTDVPQGGTVWVFALPQ